MGSLQETSMSFNSVPSKAEVMGWDSQNLADYMRNLKLSGCHKVVIKGGITGTQFMQMTECDLQVFPSSYVPIITKIQSDINKGDQKKASGHKSKAQKYPKQELVQKEEVWSSDEFDSDSDYEDPQQIERDDNYICAPNEPQTDDQQDSEEDYDMSHSADTVKPPQHLRKAEPQNYHHRDPVDDPYSAERTSGSPLPPPPRINPDPTPRPFKAPAVPSLHNKKPGQPDPSKKDSTKSKGSVVKASSSFSRKLLSKPSKPTDVHNRASKLTPAPPPQTPPDMVANSIPGPSVVTNKSRQVSNKLGQGQQKTGKVVECSKTPVWNIQQGLDPRWYRGQMTRHQAEVALREMNEDGAFVVRDSSKGSAEHKYTLMLLKQDKVYNIKICKQENSYFLGNGLNNIKCFPGVKEMITHHTHTPLRLIDATDQSFETKNECCLLHPVDP